MNSREKEWSPLLIRLHGLIPWTSYDGHHKPQTPSEYLQCLITWRITGRQTNATADKGSKTSLKKDSTKGSAEDKITQNEV